MKRRTMIGLAAVVAGGLVTGAGALALAGHGGGRPWMMKRIVSAEIDDALDQAGVTPEQRAAIHVARDRAFTAFEAHWKGRRAGVEELLTLFETDRIDLAQVEALHRRRETEHRRLADEVTAAILEVHDALTPAQRKVVADPVRAHHGWRHTN
jgi:Spy/CpxP family protein refolding chaperone